MTPVAQCKMCHSQDVEVARNGDGLWVATCYHCGHTTLAATRCEDMERQVNWVAPTLVQEQGE